VRGYVSTAFSCPYEGPVDPAAVVDVSRKLLELGVDELGVSDTIGAAVPADIRRVISALLDADVPLDSIALHLHDTYGTALANVHEALRMGVWKFDSSAGGLGGCPYAPGAAGNLATEDLVYFLEEMGVMTGVVLQGVFEASQIIADELGRTLPGKQYQRLAAACEA
jgi:hydroxymethylglutaryl-CoA lyase